MISIFPDGKISLKRHLCSCVHCIVGEFELCGTEDLDVINSKELVQIDDNDNAEPEMYTFVEVNSFVALYSPATSFEPFYVVKVISKSTANDDMIDIYGHTIQKGSKFLKGFYLEKIEQKKDNIIYEQLKNIVYIYPWEIFIPAVTIDTNLTMGIDDYLFLCNST